ncbi:MAG: hypothetical protein WCX31_06105 [Salinivirgaceae bacterium]
MKRTILTLASISLLCLSAIAQNSTEAPKIVSTNPNFGDCNVNPEIREIIVKFDQEMATGMSIVDTKDMPKVTDKPKWIDSKTLSIPVELHQNRLYTLAFNNSRFDNFRNLNGVPMNPDELIFKTKQVSFAQKNKKAYQELLKIFPEQYSYANLKEINWANLLKVYKTELENAESNTEFALKLVKMLKNANDPHLWVEVEGGKFEAGKLKMVTVNNGSQQLFSILQNRIIGKGFTTVAGNLDSVGYIAIRIGIRIFLISNKKIGIIVK